MNAELSTQQNQKAGTGGGRSQVQILSLRLTARSPENSRPSSERASMSDEVARQIAPSCTPRQQSGGCVIDPPELFGHEPIEARVVTEVQARQRRDCGSASRENRVSCRCRG